MHIRAWAGALAALLFFATPASAQTALDWWAGATFGYERFEADAGGDADGAFYGVEAAASFPVSGHWGGQVEARVVNHETEDNNSVVGVAALHAFHRTDRALVGAVIAYSGAEDVHAWAFGLEGELYGEAHTVGAQAMVWSIDDLDAELVDVNAHYRHFFTPELMAELRAGWGDVQVDLPGAEDADYWTLAAALEHQRGNLSYGGRVFYVDADGGSAAGVGFVLRWNGDAQRSLRDRDRTGPSLRVESDLLALGYTSASYDPYIPPT
ncbi:MAG: hypothetical protein AB7J28_10870 [Hyphomonadaceae bacterium]